MKKMVALLLVFVFAFVLSACNDHATTTGTSENELTTTTSENITKGDGTSASHSTTSIKTETTTKEENATSKSTTTAQSKITKKESSTSISTTTARSKTTKKESSTSISTTTAQSKTTKKESSTSASTTTITSTTTGTTHTHDYAAATCTEAQKCSCGATKGSALGHTWQDATCKAPKTCSVCQKTEGEKGPHNYIKGLCAVCNDKQIINPKIGLKENADYFEESESPYGFSLTVWRFGNSVLTIRDDPWGVYAQDTEWNGEDNGDPGDAILYNGKSYYPVDYGDLGSPKYTLTDTEIIITYDSGHHADEGHEYRLVVNYEYNLEVVSARGGIFEEGSILKLVE